MSLINHRFFPRSMFDMDYWNRPTSLGLGPSTLDLFDPFDHLDHTMGRNLLWIDRPDFLESFLAPVVPRVPHKYRITVDCAGFNPKSIQTKVSEDKTKLTVSGKEGEVKANEHEDYSVREFRRTYQLPENVETDKMISFLASNGSLVIEFPIKQTPKVANQSEELFPKIVDSEDGKSKHIKMRMTLPESINPDKIKVTCKDRDLIVQAEDKSEKEDGVSQFYYYRRCTLPENTDFESLKCLIDKNQLCIEAPINTEFKPNHRSISIEKPKQSQLKND